MNKGPSTIRESLSFLISMSLHGSVIAILALGPMYLPGLVGGQKTDVDSHGATVEFSVAENAASEIQHVQQLQSAAPMESVVAEAPVVAPAPAPAPAPKKEIATQLPKKAKVTPAPEPVQQQQPTIEEVAAIPLSDDQASSEVIQIDEPIKEEVEPLPVAQEPAPQQEVVAQEPVQESQKEIVEEAMPAPTPVNEMAKEELKESATLNVESTSDKIEKPATTESSAGAAAASGLTASTAGTIEGPGQKVEQTFASLKQAPGNVPPTYSREMRLKKLAGRGQLVYFVTKDGTVTNLRLTKSTGVAELDQAAIAAFSKYKFIPGQDGYTVHDFEFTLKGPETRDAGRLRTSTVRR